MFALLYLFCIDPLLSVITFTNGLNFLSIYLAFVKNIKQKPHSDIIVIMRLRKHCCDVIIIWEGTLQMFIWGRLHHEVQPRTLLHTIFHEKGTPFIYLLLINATPFPYLV